MKIHLRPELEEMVKQDVQRGPYQSVDEFVEHAISLLHDQEAWLAEHGSEIRAKIEQGYAAAQRDELIDSDQVRSTLDERKRSWRAENRQALAVTNLHHTLSKIFSKSGSRSPAMISRRRIASKQLSMMPAPWWQILPSLDVFERI
jgi:putative addiction module CopG family antidote